MTTMFASRISRRSLLKAAAFTITAGALTTATAPFAKAEPGTIVGTVIDFAAGVPDAQAVRMVASLALCATCRSAAPARSGCWASL